MKYEPIFDDFYKNPSIPNPFSPREKGNKSLSPLGGEVGEGDKRRA
jgi:hypothetical protein